MREIKFRAWDKTDNVMIEEYCHFGLAGFCYKKEIPAIHHLKVLQFTGLLDKNGKEIYEGDIIKCNYYPNIFKIEWMGWNPRKTWVGHYVMTDCGDESIDLYPGVEVIGNILENPELLNK